ncbi:LLM class flavin-dependent oxidoreductase [Ornithinicoccus hortensis]|uniref:FAD/FMN-containing dehydrogenase n=1 Tax=Ornithinicoccus hortensis TaxID=82346 RepID=A0A542YN13_9MICO|nr:LLM class flavin-dependent oxidoreductase [Ornithinicoccus hortensis]TQL49495.1 FAD/FMN-containing dehydrogenase [Ornithinicoccus hortensis]
MDYGQPLRFGTSITPSAADPAATVDLAVLAEEVGLDLVTVQDHPYQPRFLDAWTLLSWIAGRTGRIHLAGNVLNAPMRPPTVLAKAAASLDLLSDGRVDLALGAGHFWDAMEAMGAPRLTPRESVDALVESIEIIRGMWAVGESGPLRVNGMHREGLMHRITGAQRGPAPAHEIPVWLGALGPRMLRLVGTTADGWLPSLSRVGTEGLRGGNSRIDDAARSAGRDPREIRRLLNVEVPEGGPSAGLAGPFADRLAELTVNHGVSTFLLATDDHGATRWFATEVVPRVTETVAAARADRGTPVRDVPSSRKLAARREGIDYDAVPAVLAESAVEPGDPRYGSVRSTYLRGGRPGLVLRPRDPDEVATALAYARTQPVPLGLRSGGHGISGRSTNDGGIVIDLAALRDIEVLDERQRLVRVGAGARWGEVAAALRPHGWALSSGDYGGVGVGGLATAGGIGFLVREHGLTIDHLRAAELVLADGARVRVDAEHDPDLFWAVRGAGSAMGIVTAMEFQADEVGDVGFAQLVFDASDTAGFLQRWGAAVEAAPRDLTSFLIMGPPRAGQPVIAQLMTMVNSDDPDTVLDRLQPLAGIAPLLDQAAQIVPYPAVVNAGPAQHAGVGDPVTRSGLVRHLTPEFAEAAATLVRSGQTYYFQIRAAGGAVADVPPEATAYAHRDANFNVVAMGASRRRLDAAWAPVQEHVEGIYLSFESDLGPERVGEVFPPATLERLRAIKARVDPENVFRDNLDLGLPPAH